MQYPSGTSFDYTYTNRNQVPGIQPGLSGGNAIVSYVYDLSGNIIMRTPDNGTSSAYTVDQLNRETAVVHNLVGAPAKQFEYAYNNVNDITLVKRDSGAGDVLFTSKCRDYRTDPYYYSRAPVKRIAPTRGATTFPPTTADARASG